MPVKLPDSSVGSGSKGNKGDKDKEKEKETEIKKGDQQKPESK